MLETLPDLLSHWMITYTNRLRVAQNTWMRQRLGIDPGSAPHPGEWVICLFNNRRKQIFNGMLGQLISIVPSGDHWYDVEIDMGDFTYTGEILKYQFGKPRTLREAPAEAPTLDPLRDFKDLFDFGYCLTAHKAQGSEAEKVIVFEESYIRHAFEVDRAEYWRRWLYTAITRARKELIIIEV